VPDSGLELASDDKPQVRSPRLREDPGICGAHEVVA
jgi:hypothetical protein